MKERKEELRKLLIALFGHVPDNPIAEFGKFSDSELRVIRNDTNYATDIGYLLPEVYEVDQLMDWFDAADLKPGIEGKITAHMLFWILDNRDSQEQLRLKPESSRRALAVIDRYFTISQGKAVSYFFLAKLRRSLKLLCPSDGALELIRRWIVEKPHGHETLETSIVKFLNLWPLSKVTSVILEILETRSAGAIKGIIWAWRDNVGMSTLWPDAKTKQFLEQPLAQAVMETESAAAIYLASRFALSHSRSPDGLLGHRAREIAEALLAKHKTPVLADEGFIFLQHVDPQAAKLRWKEWLYSTDSNKVRAACYVAPDFCKKFDRQEIIDRLAQIAEASEDASIEQTAATLALFTIEKGVGHSYPILARWLNQPQLEHSALLVASRMLHRGPEDQAKQLLMDVIDDPNLPAKNRYYAMFLLCTLEPDTALEICEDQNYAGKLTDLTVLLVSVTAELFTRTRNWKRCQKLRASITTPEPEWMKVIRLDLEVPEENAEQDVAGWAYVVP